MSYARSLNICERNQIVSMASGASQQGCRKLFSYVEALGCSSFQPSMLEQELSQATRRGESLAGRGTNASAYGAFCASLRIFGYAWRLSGPCCFLINFSNPLAAARDERKGSPDSTSEYLAGAPQPPANPGLFLLSAVIRCESALVDLCLTCCGNWGGATASLCGTDTMLPYLWLGLERGWLRALKTAFCFCIE